MPTHATDRTFSEVVLVGRLGAKVDQRELPSGDVVTTFTVVVDRPARESPEASARVDAIPCQTFRPAVSARLARIPPGDLVRVEGSLRRRFWQSGSGLGSAMEVQVLRLERVRVRP